MAQGFHGSWERPARRSHPLGGRPGRGPIPAAEERTAEGTGGGLERGDTGGAPPTANHDAGRRICGHDPGPDTGT